jgi:formylglycine-generating enzyme required for sulfatase activity
MKISVQIIIIICLLFLSILFFTCQNVSRIESLVLVEGGTFQMGDLFDEGTPYEGPVHRVELSIK